MTKKTKTTPLDEAMERLRIELHPLPIEGRDKQGVLLEDIALVVTELAKLRTRIGKMDGVVSELSRQAMPHLVAGCLASGSTPAQAVARSREALTLMAGE